VIVPHGISPRSTFSQTAVGQFVAVSVDRTCLSCTFANMYYFCVKRHLVF